MISELAQVGIGKTRGCPTADQSIRENIYSYEVILIYDFGLRQVEKALSELFPTEGA